MKSRIIAVVLCVFLVAFSFVYGALKGWQQDAASVESTYSSLQGQLDTRVETAANILIVASRHLPADAPEVIALRSARDVLASPAPLEEKEQANESMTRSAEQVLAALSLCDTVQSDPRDKMYVDSMLPQMLRESAAYTAKSAYNTAVQDFNTRYRQNPISAFIAAQFGIHPFELFGQVQ